MAEGRASPVHEARQQLVGWRRFADSPTRVMAWEKEKFGERRRAGARGQSGMQDGSFPKPREENPALDWTFLPWSR